MARVEEAETAMRVQTILSVGLSVLRLLFHLLSIWLTLDWKVRKARKAFERELVKQGMAKRDARRLSQQFLKLKNEIMHSAKGYVLTKG